MRQKQADAPPDTRKQQLMEDLRRTKCALDQAYSNFENVVDPDVCQRPGRRRSLRPA